MPTPGRERFVDSARSIFVRWERWRIAYNLVLTGLVLLLSAALAHADANWYHLAWHCTVGACVANVCYFAGPAAETYLAWLGYRWRGIMPMLFTSGLLFTMLLAAATVVETLAPAEF